MAAPHQEARPRTTGEILDDAWRLYRADAPLLLAASGLFLVPALCALLVVLALPQQAPVWLHFVLPALAALLLPLTGLGAGACEEAFHLRTEGEFVTLGRCLRAAWRRGLNHLTIEAVVLVLPVLALLCVAGSYHGMAPAAAWVLAVSLLLLNLPLWVPALARHAVLTAGQKNLWRAWRLSRRAVGRHPGKAWLLAATRLVLLLLTVVNLYLFLRLGLWAAEELAGLDTAFLRLILSLGNPAFFVVLVGLAWWLLAPYNEAATYLFLVDARTRYEGLDLWYQIEQLFPVARATKVGAVLLAAGGLLLLAGPARAGGRLHEVQQARAQLATIIKDVTHAEPYPGGKHWQEAVRSAGRRLDPQGDARRGPYRWFFQAADRLGRGDRAADLKLVRGLNARLKVVEESLTWQPRAAGPAGPRAPPADDIRRLVPPGERATPDRAEREPPAEKDQPPKQKPPEPREGSRVVRGPSVGLGGLGALARGLGYLCLFVFVVLLVAVLVVGVALLVRNWRRNRPAARAAEQGVTEPGAENYLDEPDRQNVASLWRQSDELARAGRFLEAVRTLYLAVLALLHQAGLIRYERTRTNGEYADHLRRRGSLVHRPFLGLTGLFELKWYGERACRADDYQTCRDLAETIQTGAREQGSSVLNPPQANGRPTPNR
jgi:hypothetical protein